MPYCGVCGVHSGCEVIFVFTRLPRISISSLAGALYRVSGKPFLCEAVMCCFLLGRNLAVDCSGEMVF